MADITKIKIPGRDDPLNLKDAGAVRFNSQTLTDSQKEVARGNINAAGLGSDGKVLPSQLPSYDVLILDCGGPTGPSINVWTGGNY